MAKEIFVDTSGWLAVADKNDNHHAAAKKVYSLLLRDYQNLVTTNLIVAETHIGLRKRMGFVGAIGFVVKLRTATRLVRVSSNDELELQAEALLQQYDDHVFSYTDAVSFVLMKQRGITDVLTYDEHFRVMGFRIVK